MFLEVSFICEKSSLAKSLINNPGKPILIELSTFGFMGGFGTAAFLDKKRIQHSTKVCGVVGPPTLVW